MADLRITNQGCGDGTEGNGLRSIQSKSSHLNRLTNIEFVAVDLSNFDETAEPESFDFITTFDAIHDQAKLLNVLKGIHRALNSDGVYLMQDINGTSHVHEDIEQPSPVCTA
jgi:cyclopropane fatty-acyl-phospholipid synthase-like methyltransferase